MAHDLVTFGEAMVRLSPPGGRRLEQATSLDVHVGGSELNAAVAASRMGLSCGFVTRLTDNAIGRLVANRAREHGVDPSHMVWTNADRVGTYYLEYGAAPRANRVLYDRADSAMARIAPGMVPWSEILEGVSLFYTSGITAALSPDAAEAAIEAVEAARGAGACVCVDLNYRARLWSHEQARHVMTEIVKKTDILFATEEDTKRVFGIEDVSYDAVARRVAETFDLKLVAITLRENPSVWHNRWTAIAYEAASDTVHDAPTYDVEVVDRVGSGDAFVGGFLYGYLREGIAEGVRYGVALSAIKQTVPGDLVYATRDEVDRALNGGSLRIER
jgi:2-dehydro-3-deoxygluconokinase